MQVINKLNSKNVATSFTQGDRDILNMLQAFTSCCLELIASSPVPPLLQDSPTPVAHLPKTREAATQVTNDMASSPSVSESEGLMSRKQSHVVSEMSLEEGLILFSRQHLGPGVTAEQLETVLDAARHMEARSDWEATVAAAAKVVDSDRCVAFRVYEPGGRLTARLEDGRMFAVPSGTGIAGHVVETKEAISLPDVSSSAIFSPRFDEMTEYLTKSLLCIPVVHHGKVTAVLQWLNKEVRSTARCLPSLPHSHTFSRTTAVWRRQTGKIFTKGEKRGKCVIEGA